VNTQPPLQEIWLAARRGGFHFRQLDGRWLDRDGQEFFERCRAAPASRPACAAASARRRDAPRRHAA
jgi:CyaY protein